MAILATIGKTVGKAAGKAVKNGISSINKSLDSNDNDKIDGTGIIKGMVAGLLSLPVLILALIMFLYLVIFGGGYYLNENPSSVTSYTSAQQGK